VFFNPDQRKIVVRFEMEYMGGPTCMMGYAFVEEGKYREKGGWYVCGGYGW
jgi:hypothetical protein